MARERILETLGYDPQVIATLARRDRRAMRGVATAWLVACGVLASAAGVAAWVLEPAIGLAIAIAGFTFLLVLNFLRVTIAGGGVSPRDTTGAVGRWKPSLAPALVLGALAALLAQPLQISLHSDELDALMQRYRRDVIAEQVAAARSLGEERAEKRYSRQIGARSFPALRMQLLWRTPGRAVRWTAVFCMIVLVPVIWARWMALDALRNYERERRRRTRARLGALTAQMHNDVDRALAAFRRFEPSRFTRSFDAFGNRRVSRWLGPATLSAEKTWLRRGNP